MQVPWYFIYKLFAKDGYETEFAVNHLGHFYLTPLLTEKLQANGTLLILPLPLPVAIVNCFLLAELISVI